MRLPSGEICGSTANCRLKTSIGVRRSERSCDLSSFFSASFFSCAKEGMEKASRTRQAAKRRIAGYTIARLLGPGMKSKEVYRRERDAQNVRGMCRGAAEDLVTNSEQKTL